MSRKYIFIDLNPPDLYNKEQMVGKDMRDSVEETFSFLSLLETTDWEEEDAIAIAHLNVGEVHDMHLSDDESDIVEHWQVKRIE